MTKNEIELSEILTTTEEGIANFNKTIDNFKNKFIKEDKINEISSDECIDLASVFNELSNGKVKIRIFSLTDEILAYELESVSSIAQFKISIFDELVRKVLHVATTYVKVNSCNQIPLSTIACLKDNKNE